MAALAICVYRECSGAVLDRARGQRTSSLSRFEQLLYQGPSCEQNVDVHTKRADSFVPDLS